MSKHIPLALLTTLAATGCGDRTPTPPDDTNQLVPAGDAVVLGQVVGRTYYQLPGDTSYYLSEEPLAGARVDAFFLGMPPDSGQLRDTMPRFVGSGLADTQGRFTFGSLPGGDYELRAYSPTDSAMAGWERVFVEEHGTTVTTIVVPLVGAARAARVASPH